MDADRYQRDGTDVQMVNLATGLLRSMLLLIAISVYGWFRLDLDSASQDIFDNMDDPVLLLSSKNEILLGRCHHFLCQRLLRSCSNCVQVIVIFTTASLACPAHDITPPLSHQTRPHFPVQPHKTCSTTAPREASQASPSRCILPPSSAAPVP